MACTDTSASLRRELGLGGSLLLGLGSILGTGVFVSIGIAAGVAGPSVLLAIVIAGALALCNAMSSAQLAARMPTSGGTYEYGRALLSPALGFVAGWLFLCAKSASGAAAALGFGGYCAAMLGLEGGVVRAALAAIAVGALGLTALSGVRRSSVVNAVIVSVTVAALLVFVVAGAPVALRWGGVNLSPFFGGVDIDSRPAAARLLEAAALMFVAYTGYGRIATMGEEVRDPERTIPRAIVLTLAVSMGLYLLVALVGVGGLGAARLGEAGVEMAAPLAVAAGAFGPGWVVALVAVGAMTAMLGVLLNLILGLSRVALAMGRRGDLPRHFAVVDPERSTPRAAVALVSAVILALALSGSVKLAWSFSAFTVLVYYALTNAAALRLSREERLFHPGFAWAGLAGCLSLAFWVEARVWAAGLAVIVAGLAARGMLRRAGRGGTRSGA